MKEKQRDPYWNINAMKEGRLVGSLGREPSQEVSLMSYTCCSSSFLSRILNNHPQGPTCPSVFLSPSPQAPRGWVPTLGLPSTSATTGLLV